MLCGTGDVGADVLVALASAIVLAVLDWVFRR